ncbi:MAG: A/G-specific adenine glycosylase [Spirosomataceae bacterium]
MNNKFFAEKVIRWYKHNHRDLPWRHTRDPYFIWLSEVILQQTRIAQGLPYYERFITAYPTVFDLASAPEQEVIRHWQGLGYYSRARNLHQTAKYIVRELDGRFPDSYLGLLQLKGIGPYTAAAIASFAYDEAVAVVDGNVYRVLARVFGIETDISSTQGQKQFSQLANRLIPPDRPAIYNQAVMEFGAIHCTPLSPDCLLCPLQAECNANATGRVNQLPVKLKKTKVRERFFNYFVFVQGDLVAMRQRTERDVWAQLYDFHLIETDSLISSPDELPDSESLSELLSKAAIMPPTRVYTQLLSHQRIRAQFWIAQISPEITLSLPENLTFFTHADIDNVPKPVLITSYWKEQFF